MKVKNIVLSFLLFSIVLLSNAQNYTISGYVKDSASGEALGNSFVSTTSQGKFIDAFPNAYGFYSMSVPAGTYKIRFSMPGYKGQIVTRNVSANLTLTVDMVKKVNTIKKVVVKGKKEGEGVQKIEMSENKLSIGQIKRMPALLGEVDVIRSIQLLPGVSTVGEGASGFNVRGGNIDQNLVLLDEAPLFSSSHLFGFFSVFNPDAVRNVKLIKGGIPASYGGRLSSVLDVRSKEGNMKKFGGAGGIGAIFSRGMIEGPIKKDKSSFLLAARRSYIDILAKPFLPKDAAGAAFYFWDVTAKANYIFSPLNRVYVSSYFGRDKFSSNEFGFDWGSQTVTARWNHTFNTKLFANTTAIYSKYDYRLNTKESDGGFDWSSNITNYTGKIDFNWYASNKQKIDFGFIGTYYNFTPGKITITESDGKKNNFGLPDKLALESGIFIDDEYRINRNITVKGGMRLSYFDFMGKGSAYYYQANPAGALNQSRTLDTIRTFSSFKSIKNYINPEPRLAAKFRLDSNSSFKLSYNRMVQYIHLISNTTASVPLDIWTPSTNNIKPEIADQVAIGYFRNFGKKTLFEFSVETYYKQLQNQINYIDGANLLLNEFLEADLLYGNGRAFGAEFYIKKASGRLTGWLSYTLARTEILIKGLNNDAYFPTRFDRPHNLSLVGSYEFNKKWTVSANFSYQAGTPATFPTSQYTWQGITIPHNAFNSRNGARIPAYHRLDISAICQLKKWKKWASWEHEIVFGAYNVYNRRNPFSVYFQGPTDKVNKNHAIRYAIIGSIVPSITYNFKF